MNNPADFKFKFSILNIFLLRIKISLVQYFEIFENFGELDSAKVHGDVDRYAMWPF